MNGLKKAILILFFVCISFLTGYIIASDNCSDLNGDSFIETEREGKIEVKEELTGNEESETSTTNNGRLPESPKYKRNKPRWESDLTAADEVLLDRHLYGQWVFTERLQEVEKYRGIEDWKTNFSMQGVEEMKNVVISYEKTEVYGYHYEQSTFKDAGDMYLYMIYGGANPVAFPVYHVNYEVDENDIYLRDLVNLKGKSIKFPGKDKLVKIYYNLGYDEHSTNPVIMGGNYLGNIVYIDPDDTESIYMDFCGLWKLERYQYGRLGRNGKQYDTGL